MKNKKIDFIINIMYFTLITLIVFGFVRFIKLFSPFLIGFFISVLIYPAVKYLKEKIKVPAPFSAGILVTLILSVVASIIFLLSSLLYKQILSLSQKLPHIINDISMILTDFLHSNRIDISVDMITNVKQSISSSAVNFSVSALSNLTDGLSSVPSLFIFFAAAVISCVLFCGDMPRIRIFLREFLPRRFRVIALEIKRFSSATLLRMLKAYAVIMLITFFELALGLYLFGIENPLMKAILIALVDILPVLGCGTVLLPWALLSSIGGNIALGIKLAVLYLIIACVRQFVEPKIVGSNIGMNPLLTLVSVYVGFRISGLAGMFIFPILVITVLHLFKTGYIKFPK